MAEYVFSHGFHVVRVRSRAEVDADPLPGRRSDGGRLWGFCEPKFTMCDGFLDQYAHISFLPEALRRPVRKHLTREAVVLFAGPRADARQSRCGYVDAVLRGGVGDWREANKIARFVTACDDERDAFLDIADRAACRFLLTPIHWRAIQGLADLLLEHGAVNEAMAHHILSPLPRRAP